MLIKINFYSYSWGELGLAHIGPSAKKQALADGLKAEGPSRFVDALKQDITHISDHDIGVVAELIYSAGYDTTASVATIAILRRAKLEGMFTTQGDED